VHERPAAAEMMLGKNTQKAKNTYYFQLLNVRQCHVFEVFLYSEFHPEQVISLRRN
jgi:hypothetical protein